MSSFSGVTWLSYMILISRKAVLGMLVALSLLLTATQSIAAPDGARWGANYFPNFTVIDQHGRSYKFYDDLIKNKKVAVNFIYTTCPDICSLSTARLAAVQERLGDLVGKDFHFYSISLDPVTDTPEKLRVFADSFSIKPGWLFLTGKPKELGLIRYKLGERSRSLSEHNNLIMLGNDETGEWARSSSMAEPKLLESHIRELDPKWLYGKHKRKRVRVGGRLKQLRMRDAPGEALFIKACGACHTIGGGEHIGPDLFGVLERRDHNWLVNFIMKPDRMRAKGDPIARRLDAKYPGVVMPNLSISKTDADDLLKYLKMRTKTKMADKKPNPPKGSHAGDRHENAAGHAHDAHHETDHKH